MNQPLSPAEIKLNEILRQRLPSVDKFSKLIFTQKATDVVIISVGNAFGRTWEEPVKQSLYHIVQTMVKNKQIRVGFFGLYSVFSVRSIYWMSSSNASSVINSNYKCETPTDDPVDYSVKQCEKQYQKYIILFLTQDLDPHLESCVSLLQFTSNLHFFCFVFTDTEIPKIAKRFPNSHFLFKKPEDLKLIKAMLEPTLEVEIVENSTDFVTLDAVSAFRTKVTYKLKNEATGNYDDAVPSRIISDTSIELEYKTANKLQVVAKYSLPAEEIESQSLIVQPSAEPNIIPKLRTCKKDDVNNLVKKITDLIATWKLDYPLRILLAGPLGSGKTSFLNTITSILAGSYIEFGPTTASQRSVTKYVKDVDLRDFNTEMKVILRDTPGYHAESATLSANDVLQDDKNDLYNTIGFDKVLNGLVGDNFSEDGKVSSISKTVPEKKERPHTCILFIERKFLHADVSPNISKTFCSDYFNAATDYRPIVAVTKVDTLITKNERFCMADVYTSPAVEEVLNRMKAYTKKQPFPLVSFIDHSSTGCDIEYNALILLHKAIYAAYACYKYDK